MKMRALALAVAAALAANSAQALVIDDFASGFVEWPGINARGPSGSASGTQSGSMLGGQRVINLQMLTGSNVSVVTVPEPIPPDTNFALNIDNGVNERSKVTITWTTAPVDLTDSHLSSGLYLTIPSPIDHPMDVTFSVVSASGTSTATQNFVKGTMGKAFYIPFSSFTGSADLQQATQVALELTSTEAALDTQVTLVDNGVPIPGTLVLMGVGFVGLARSIARASRR